MYIVSILVHKQQITIVEIHSMMIYYITDETLPLRIQSKSYNCERDSRFLVINRGK